MSAKNGKPCKKCGTSEWYKRGNCKECQRDRNAKWEKANPGKTRERSAKWNKDNPGKVGERSAKWRKDNPDRMREDYNRWAKANPEAINAINSRRRTRKTEAGGSYTAAEWKALVNHFGNKCLCCGRTDVKLTADHVIPISKGGSSFIENMQPLCRSCNSRKKNKTIDYRPGSGLGRWIQRKLFG